MNKKKAGVENPHNASENAAKQSPAPANANAKTKKRGRGGGLGTALTTLLAVAALAVALWGAWQLHLQGALPKQNAAAIAALNAAEARAKRAEAAFTEQLRAVEAQAFQNDKAIHALLGAMKERIAALWKALRQERAENASDSAGHAQRPEDAQPTRGVERDADRRMAAGFLHIAALHRRLGDEQAAREALLQADDLLAAAGNPTAGGARSAIREALTTPAAAFDAQAADAALRRLIAAVDDLPLAAPPANFRPSVETTPTEGAWGRIGAELGRLVRIRKADAEGPALTDRQREVARHILALRLERARSALLLRRQQAWTASLAAARAWIERAFDAHAAAVAQMLAELERLHSAQIAPRETEMRDALAALRRDMGPGAKEGADNRRDASGE